MKKQDIINAIETKRGTISYKSWTIGVTDTPAERKQQHESEGENVNSWKHWKTDSETEGRAIEKHFLDNLGLKFDYAYREMGILGKVNSYTIGFLF